MKFSFQPQFGMIYVDVEVEGPTGTIILQLSLDTGSPRTVLNPPRLIGVGYDPSKAIAQTTATTASGSVTAPIIRLSRLKALGQERDNLDIIGHTLPSSASSEGLLGLDFFRGRILTIDFSQGVITLT